MCDMPLSLNPSLPLLQPLRRLQEKRRTDRCGGRRERKDKIPCVRWQFCRINYLMTTGVCGMAWLRLNMQGRANHSGAVHFLWVC